jgi:hypothetical protein
MVNLLNYGEQNTTHHTTQFPTHGASNVFRDFEFLRSGNLQIIGCWKPILFNGRMTP